MPSKLVHVELGPEGNVIRIFRNKDWRLLPDDRTKVMTKADAVREIRWQVYERSFVTPDVPDYGHHECERCGRSITWTTMEMNERVPKGSAKQGEVSLENCEALCHDCHQGSPDSAHGNRRWHTAKLKGQDV